MNTELKGVDLSDSFVLGWKRVDEDLVFDLELSLWPESEFYQKPEEKEWTCYRRGTLTFRRIEIIDGLKKEEEATYTVDPDGAKDFGSIEAMEEKNGYIHMLGDFGNLRIKCLEWDLKIDEERRG